MSEQDQTVELALLRKDMELLQSDMAEVKGDLKKLADVSCSKLLPEGGCGIYENRPGVCRG